MRFESVLDSFYVLGSLWGGVTSPQVCSSNVDVLRRVARTVSWSLTYGREVTAFVGVNVVPMDSERVLTNQTVLIEGGRITALGLSSQVKVPDEAVRVDGSSKYLIPGLANMHPHGRVNEASLQAPGFQSLMLTELAGGVTAIRHIVGGELTPQQLRKYMETAKVPGPRMYISPQIPGADGSVPPSFPLDSVAVYIAAAKAAGYAHIGMKPQGVIQRDPRTLAFIDSVVVAARRIGLPVADHSHRLSFESVLALGATGGSVEHLSGVFWDTLGLWPNYRTQQRQPAKIPLEKIPALAAAIRRAGTWVTPTLECMERKHTFITGMPQMVKIMQDAGVGMLLAGDDGNTVHEELTALVKAGLTPYQALVTGTRNPAQYFGLQDSSGTVTVGKWADLVLLGGNPLEDIRFATAPVGVVIGGHWFDRPTLEKYRATLKPRPDIP